VISGEGKCPIKLDFGEYNETVVLAFLEFIYTSKLPAISGCDREALTKLAKE